MDSRIFIIIFKFLRELFFDRKEEADFRSQHFKPRRWLAFITTVMAFFLSIFLAMRVINLAIETQKLRKASENCAHDIKK